MAEIYNDAAVRLAPVTKKTALEMLHEVEGLAPVRGYRGLPRGDLEAVATIIHKLSQLAFLVDTITDAEINPVIIKKRGAVAVDGLIVKKIR